MIPSFRKSLDSLKNNLAADGNARRARRRRANQARKQPLAAQQEALEARQLLSAIQVTSNADSGVGSLREAIATANANKEADTITFASGVTSITLTGGELVLSETGADNRTTIKGPVSISGNDASRIFTVKPGVFAALSSLTLTNGRATGDGGAIVNQGGLDLIGTTVKDSFATGKSGAVQLTSGTLDIVNSTLSGNRADQWGGAIGADDGRLTISSSTLTNNRADADANGSGDGGAISYPPKVVASLFNSILAGNTKANGTADDMTGGANLHKDSSNNLIGNSSVTLGLTHGTNGNQLGNGGSGVIDINTVLDTTLKDNGGGALTHSLIAASPALDAGDARYFRTPVIVDQRNQPRVDGDGIDIGAVETVVATAPNIVDVDGVRFVSTGNFNRPLTKFTAAGDAIVAVGGGNVAGHTQPANALDGNPDTKYFQDSWTSAPGLTITPASGSSTVAAFRLTTADDVPDRDPSSYKLEGANSTSGPFTLIAEGGINLPAARKTAGPTITFNNSTAYTSYRLTFPTLKGASTTQTQISELELFKADTSATQVFETSGSVQMGLVPTGGAAFIPSLELRSGVRIATSGSGANTFSTTALISTTTQGRSLDLMSGTVDGDPNQRILIPVKSLTSATGYAISDKQAATSRLSDGETFTATRITLVAVPVLRELTSPGDQISPVGSSPHATHVAANAIDGNLANKYLNFTTSDAGLILTPSSGATTATTLRLTTAGDVPDRDPASYKLEGGNSPSGPFTLISEGALTLPGTRGTTVNVPFTNTTAYTSYRLVFPSVKGNGAGSTQIAEIELLGEGSVNLSLSGRLGFDAFGGAGVQLEGPNRLLISPTNLSAQIQTGAIPVIPSSKDKKGKPAPISFNLTGMNFDAGSLSASYDATKQEFEFKGDASTFFDGGTIDVVFGATSVEGFKVRNGVLQPPELAFVDEHAVGGVKFQNSRMGITFVAQSGGDGSYGNHAPFSATQNGPTNYYEDKREAKIQLGDSNNPLVVNQISFTPGPNEKFDPAEFVLKGFDAQGSGTALSSGALPLPASRTTRTNIRFRNSTAYAYYEISFPEIRDSASSRIQISGLQLHRKSVLQFSSNANTATLSGTALSTGSTVDFGPVGFGVDRNPGDTDARVGSEIEFRDGQIQPFSLPLTTLTSGPMTFTNRIGTSTGLMRAEFSPKSGEFRITGNHQRLTYTGDLSAVQHRQYKTISMDIGLTELSGRPNVIGGATPNRLFKGFDGNPSTSETSTNSHESIHVTPRIKDPVYGLRITAVRDKIAPESYRLTGIDSAGAKTVLRTAPVGINTHSDPLVAEFVIPNPQNVIYASYEIELFSHSLNSGHSQTFAEIELLTVNQGSLKGNGLRIANGELQDFSVPVESIATLAVGFSLDPLKPPTNPITLRFESQFQRSTITGTANANTFGSPVVGLGNRGTDGLILDFKTPANGRLSYAYDQINLAGMPYRSTNSAVEYVPSANRGNGGLVYSGSGQLAFGKRFVNAIPNDSGFVVDGEIDAGGLIISTQGLGLRPTHPAVQYVAYSIANRSSTIQLEGKSAAVVPLTDGSNAFFNFGDGKLIYKGSGETALSAPLSFSVDGVQFDEKNGKIIYPEQSANPGLKFLYKTASKVDFQVGDIKTKATVSVPLDLKNGGLTVANGSTYNLDKVTIQNVIFQDGAVQATYSEKDRRFNFLGKGSYLGLKDVTFGSDPAGPQIFLERGVFQLKNFTPPVVDVVAAGVTFPTLGLNRTTVGQTVTLTGSKTIDVGGAQITVELGGGGTNGLVVNNGTVTEISGTLSGTFTVGGVEFTATGTLQYLVAEKELRITGAATMAVNTTTGPVNIAINLGDGGTPGLVIKEGIVETIQASVSADFTLFGLEIDVQSAGFSYNRAKQEYGFFGTVAISTPDKGGQRMLNNFSVTLGAPSSPGMVIRNGELEYLSVELNGSINLFGINATPENLRITYHRSLDLLALQGGITVTVAGKFQAKAAFPGRGLEINTRTGEVQIKGLELRVADVKFGTLEINDLGFIYEVDDQGNTTISGSGEITLPAGLTVGAEVVIKNNRLKKIGFKVERSPGIPLGHPPVVFLNSIEGEIDNLDDLDNFQIKAKVTGTVGPSVKIFGQTRALVTVEGSIDINKDRMIIQGDVDLLEGIMGEGTGRITIFFKGKEVVDVSASFSLYPGGIFRGNMSFKMDRDFNITLNANLGFFVPDPVPIVGGDSLGNFGIYLQIRPTQSRENSYVRVSGDIKIAEFEVTVNFAGRVDGWADPPWPLSKKHFGFQLPGARDLDFLLPLSEGNFDAIDAFTEVPAPELGIDSFAADSNGPGATIAYTGTSQLPENTTIDLFVDTVDSGFNGHLIAGGLAFLDGQQMFDWDDMAAFASVPYDPNQKLYVYGLINDGSNIPVFTSYSTGITPPNLTPTIALPTQQTFGANQPLVFSNNTSNAVTIADPLAAQDADAQLVVNLNVDNGSLTIDPQKATPWQNISDPNDVDGDGTTSVSDALQIITMLNMDSMQGDDGSLPTQRSSIGSSGFYDVNGDGKVTSDDANGLTDSLLNGPSTTVSTTVFDNVEVTGDGSSAVTLIGNVADINKVLDGLTYDPLENVFFEDSFSVSVNRYPEFYIDRLTESVLLKPRALTVGSADGVEFMPVSYEQGSGHAFLLEDVQVESAAAGYINSATIAIDGFKAGKDVLELNILDQRELGITASFDAAKGVLHLSGFGRIDEYRRAIGLVSFCSNGTGERTLQVKLGDRAANIGATGVKVRIISQNQAPVVTPGMGATYIAGSGSSVALLPSISVVDSDSATLEGAVIEFDAASFNEGEDVLSYEAADGITGAYNAMTGRLELRGTASAADYSAALLRVKYRNTSTSATIGVRDVSITVSDGNAINAETTARQRLLVVDANTTLQGTTLGGLPTKAATQANGEGNFVLAPNLTLTNVDAAVDSLMKVEVAITGNFMPGDDFLDVVGLPIGMDASFDVMTGILSITGEVPVDWYEYMLQQVTYSNRSMVRDGVARTISFTVHDGFTKGTPQTMTVQAEALPVVEAGLGATQYETGGSLVLLDDEFSVMYMGNGNLTGATIAFSWDYNADQDRLVFTDANGITGSFDETSGVLTLTGTATVAHYQAALRSVEYTNTRTNPIPGLRQVDVTIADGTKLSDPASLLISVDTEYVAPTMTIDVTEQAFTEGSAAIVVADTFTTAQQDAAAADGRGTVMLHGAAISIEGYVAGEDVLAFEPFSFTPDADPNDPGDGPDTVTIDGEFDTELGQLLLTGRASLDQYQTVIRSITYENVSEAPTTSDRVIHIMMQSGALDGEAPPVTIRITSLNNPPTQVSGPSAEVDMLENVIAGTLGLENVEYAPPSDREPDLVYTVTALPPEELGHVEFTDDTGSVTAVVDGIYSVEQLRSAVFVPALNVDGGGVLEFTIAGWNPILEQVDPAHLTESIDVRVNGVATKNPSDAFIAQLHRDLLSRNATQTELDDFSDDQEFHVSRQAASETLQASEEYRNAWINSVYERLLNRAATTEELDSWNQSDSISFGDVPLLDEVLPTVMSSDEYFSIRGADSFETFVDSVFLDLMNREPTDAERDFEVDLLQDGVERSDIVTAIQHSDEASAIIVRDVIGALLRRAGGQFEVVDFARLLQGNGRQWLVTHFASSDEYFIRYGTQERSDSRTAEELQAELLQQWLVGEATTGNSQVTSNFEPVGIISTDGRGHGGGTLIGDQYVLTAAHLVDGKDISSLKFTVGGTSYGLDEVNVHPDYEFGFLGTDDGNDLAILKLNRPVVDVSPALLWQGRLQTGDSLTLVGFGPHPGDESFGTKRSGTTPIDGLSPNLVTWVYNGADEATTVPGDSGSPQFVTHDGQFYIASVASGGTHQALSVGDFAYNTRVNSYSEWVAEITGQETRSVGDGQTADRTSTADVSLADGAANANTPRFLAFNNTHNIELSGNDLLIQDISTSGEANDFLISTTTTDVVISDAQNLLTTTLTGAAGSGTHTVTVPLSAFTGDIIIHSNAGDDAIEVTTPSRIVTIDAGPGQNELTVIGSDSAAVEEFATGNASGQLEVVSTGASSSTVRATNVQDFALNTRKGNDTVRPGDLSGLSTALDNLWINLGEGDDLLDAVNASPGITANGENGNDTLTGSPHNDTLIGGAGDDISAGGAGDDTYVFDVDDVIGSDTITEAANEGTDTLDFGPTDFVTVGLDLRTVGTQQNVDTNNNLQLTLSDDIENITGGANGNALIGDDGANILRGGDGIDFILGVGGDDQLFGGVGPDTLRSASASATNTAVVQGGDGPDMIEFSGAHVAFPLNGPATFDIEGSNANQHDQVRVFGDSRVVSLGGPLELNLGQFTPAVNDTFMLINLIADTSSVSGNFIHNGQPLSEGGTFVDDGRQFRISYTGGTGNDVEVTFVRRLPGITVTPTSVVPTVTEGGSTEIVHVVLDTQPASDVVVMVASSDTTEATTDQSKLTFTSVNWNLPQLVVVTGVNDAAADGNLTTAITFSVEAAASDDGYDTVASHEVVIITLDDDVVGLPTVLTPSSRISETQPTFSWHAVPTATEYELWVGLIGSQAGPVINRTQPGTSYTATEVLGIGRYVTWVRATLADGTQSEWTSQHFQVNIAPDVRPMTFHSPTARPEFSWTAIPEATGYRVFVRNATSGTTAVIDEVVSGTTLTPGADFGFGRHQVWVRAINANNYAAMWSDGQEFYVGPQLTNPNRFAFSHQPTFEWETMPGIENVQVWIQRGSTVEVNQPSVTGNTFTPSAALPAGDYRWWIRPSAPGGGLGAWSPAGRINIGGRTQVTTVTPTSDDSLAKIEWHIVEDAGRYEVYLYDIDRGELVNRKSNITDTEFETPPLKNGNYRVWVRAFHTNGNNGLWSRAHDFSVDAATLSTNATPVRQQAVTFDSNLQLAWTGNSSDTYDIYVTNGNVSRNVMGISGTSWTPTETLSGTKWKWQVRTRNASGAVGPWSDIATIDMTGRPVLLAPIGSTNATPTIQWTSVTGTIEYTLHVDRLDTNENGVIRAIQIQTASLTTQSPLPAGSYRAWVQALNTTTNQLSPWSVPLNFTVAANPLEQEETEQLPIFLSSVLQSKETSTTAPEPSSPEVTTFDLKTEGAQSSTADLQSESMDNELSHLDEQFEKTLEWLSVV